MNKSFIQKLLLLIPLALLFGVICFCLLFWKTNPRLIRSKLKVGAILIGLTALSSGCWSGPTCYLPPLEPLTEINIAGMSNSILSVSVSGTISGSYPNTVYSNIAYQITRKGEASPLQSGILEPKDGIDDSQWEEEFAIILENSVTAGEYELVFFAGADSSHPVLNQFTLIVE